MHATPPAEPAATPRSIMVMGCGSVGGFVGGSLQGAGLRLDYIGRPRMMQALRQHGLHLSDLDGRTLDLAPAAMSLAEHPSPACRPDLVLLAVKCGATAEAARELAAVLPPGTPVLSLQNGIGQAALGEAAAPALVWLAGMVPYNIAELGPGRLHRGTGGRLAAQDHPVLRRLQPLFERAGLGLDLHADLAPLQWGKLLLNLNNPVNALSGLPLKAQLLDRGYRRIFAALQQEALAVLAAAGIQPARVALIRPAWMPWLLRLPDGLFRRAAARMLQIDDKARSSMADDLARSRPTEIDALCGAVVRLAARHQRQAPLAGRMIELVQAWPLRQRPWPADELLHALRAG